MAKILDMSEGGTVLDMSDSDVQPTQRKKRWEIMWDAARIGFKDTARGVQQIAGLNEDALTEEQNYLDELMNDSEHGGWAKAAYAMGLIADPAGWLLPVSKLKTATKLGQLMLPGVVGGGIAGGLSYIPEGQSRGEMAALGAGLGAVAGPAAMGAKKLYEPVGEAVFNIMKTPVGAGGIAGAGFGLYNTDPNATIPEKMNNAIIGALVGGSAGFGARGINKASDGALARAVIPDYGLADAWINARSAFKGERKIISGEFDKLTKEMAALKPEERKVLYGMLTDPTAPRDEMLEGLAQRSRDTINKYGEKLVDLGVLGRETFDANKDVYIHRMYNDPDKILGNARQRILVAGDELTLRGNIKDISKADWDAGIRPDDAPGWNVVSTTTFERTGGEKLKIRRDWTPEERSQMKEVTDAMISFDRTGKLLANDVSALKFFKDMSNPDLGIAASKSSGRMNKQVPDDRRFGDLKGKFVSKETYNDLMSIRELNKISQYRNTFEPYRKLNRFWKGSKTVANPAVHFNNFVSNVVHYDFANGNTKDFFKAVRDLYKKSDDFMEAESRGVFGGFFGTEVSKDAMSMLKLYGEKSSITDNMKLAGGALDYSTKIAQTTKKYTWDAATKLYNLEDQVFRMALYRTERDRLIRSGLGAQEAKDMAARKAREWFVDYERQAPVLEILREGPLPFASYMYGVIPKLAETAARKPIKLAKWGLLFAGLNSLSEQDEKQRSLLDEKYPTMFGLPGMPSTMVKLPEFMSPETKDDWYLNIGRNLPGGNIFGVESDAGVGKIPYLPEFMQPSFGAAGGVYDSLTGINRFTGQTTNDPRERMELLGRQFMPNFPIPGLPTYSGEKIERALSGKQSPTRDVYTPGAAIASGLGLKIQPVNTSKMLRGRAADFDKKKRELQAKRKSEYRDWQSGEISDEEWMKAKEQYKKDVRELYRKRRGN